VCLFGQIRIVEDREVKQRFCEALMAKYGKPETKRPKGFFPRIDVITVYAIAVERMTGKECPLPPLSEQWPAKDRTKSPNASQGPSGTRITHQRHSRIEVTRSTRMTVQRLETALPPLVL
jgi:hypothetical protein